MAVQKNFTIRNGLEVNNNLLVADSATDYVGIGTSNPKYTLEVIGGIGVTYANILGIATVGQEFNVGTGGTVITSLDTGLTGFGTATPAYVVDIRSPVSTGQTALYVQGDVEITGDLYADDINLDQATFNNIEVTGIATVGILTANNIEVTGIATVGILTANALYAGFTTTSSLAVVNPNIAVLTVGHDVDGSGQDHFGIYYDNTPGTPGTGGTANVFVSNGDLRFDVVDGTSDIIFGSQFTNNYLTVSGFDGTVTVTGLINADTSNIGFATITVLDSTEGLITTIESTNLNTTGIGSFGSVNTPTARITTGIVTTINNANLRVSGIASINTGVVTTAYVNTGIITTLSGANLSYSGIGSFGSVNADTGRVNTGIVTNLVTTGIASIAVGVVTNAYLTTGIVTNLVTSGIGTITTAVIGTGNINTGIITTLSGANLSYSGIGTINTASIDLGYVKTGIVTNLSTSGIGTITTAVIGTGNINTGVVTTLTGTTLNYSGIGTVTNFNSTNSTITTVNATNVTATGIVTANQYTINGTSVISSGRQLQNIASLDATTTATIETAIANAPNTSQDIVVTGIASINTGVFTSFFSPVGIITTLSGANINYSGIGSFGSVNADIGRINTGIVTNLTVSGIATFQSDVKLGDNDNLDIGDSGDLRLFHNSTDSFIKERGTGNLYIDSTAGSVNIRVNDNESAVVANQNGAVELYYDSIKEFETTAYGANVSGVLQSQGLNSSGIATISVNSSSDALRITQTGAGNALVVEDSTNPDATPFVVTGIGSVGIGTNNPASSLHAVHPNTSTVSLTWGATSGQILRNEDSELAFGLNSSSPYSYYLQARTKFNAARQIIINPLGGSVGIETSNAATTLDVGGTASIKVPVGTTAERPGSPVRGFVRFNTDLNTFEGYNGSEWGGLGGAAEKDTAVSTTSATTCESFAVASYRSATITAQITQGSNYQVGKYVVIHDGTTATLIEESAIATGSMLGSFTATVSGGNLLFQVNMSSASSATVTTLMTKVSV